MLRLALFRRLLSNMDMVLAKSDLAMPHATPNWSPSRAARAISAHPGRVELTRSTAGHLERRIPGDNRC
jgi:phosphoenolpyruvate carboxylase